MRYAYGSRGGVTVSHVRIRTLVRPKLKSSPMLSLKDPLELGRWLTTIWVRSMLAKLHVIGNGGV